MRGKRAKRLRRKCDFVLKSAEGVAVSKENRAAAVQALKVKVGRKHRGPAFAKFAYPPSIRLGEIDVLSHLPEEVKAIEVEN